MLSLRWNWVKEINSWLNEIVTITLKRIFEIFAWFWKILVAVKPIAFQQIWKRFTLYQNCLELIYFQVVRSARFCNPSIPFNKQLAEHFRICNKKLRKRRTEEIQICEVVHQTRSSQLKVWTAQLDNFNKLYVNYMRLKRMSLQCSKCPNLAIYGQTACFTSHFFYLKLLNADIYGVTICHFLLSSSQSYWR